MESMRTSEIAPAIDEQPVFQLLDWLTFRPTADDLARGLVTDYLRKHGASKARFALLAEDDSLHHIGAYGFDNPIYRSVESSSDWRARKDKVKEVIWNDNFIGWTPDRTVIGAAIRDRGISKGSVVIEFDAPVENHVHVLDLVTKIVRIISFYLLNTHGSITSAKSGGSTRREVSRGDFTSRQIQILKGMVEGKTNHELASDLGYSVSTVRHETMRIFQILGVSDRREAARTALDRGVI